MDGRWDAVVIGGGAMGTATALALARRGRRTLLLERFRIGHERGSSHGPTRIFRFSYHHPDYVRMAVAARDQWQDLEREAGQELLRTTGGLDVGPGAEIAAAALRAAGVRFRWLGAEEAADRWPGLLLDPGSEVLFQEDAGVLTAGVAVAAMARLAAKAGAEVREETQVEAVVATPSGDGVEVRTPHGTLQAGVAVVTAGSWAAGLLETAGIDLPVEVTREQVTYFQQESPSGLPTLIEWAEESAPSRYAVPDPSRPGTVKLGEHLAGPVVDPDARTFEPDLVGEARVQDWAARRFAGLRPVRSETCLYTTTPDEDFVLDRVGPVVVGSACSGHGFKFAPLIGECLSALATGDPPPVPLERFRASRPPLVRTK